jgi:phosphate transport system substrate-binding protein
MKHLSFMLVAALAPGLLSTPASAQMRRNIQIVGSSTVYPFAKSVAEKFARTTPGAATPVIESTGTGAGMKLFCAGIGPANPDMTNASRRIKLSEYTLCQTNGVTLITEIAVGLDGLTLATSKTSQSFPLTTRDIYAALAATPFGKTNTSKTWKDVNSKLPAVAIRVYGPPSTSGTRDSLHELIMKPGCNSNSTMAALAKTDAKKYDEICVRVRTDGAYVEQGENDNLIVQKLSANPGTIGIMGYGYVEENMSKLNPVMINGVLPSQDTIQSFKYPGSRPLYFYVKNAHIKAIPGIRAYAAEFVKETTFGPQGSLTKLGLIALTDAARKRSQALAASLTPMTADGLK